MFGLMGKILRVNLTDRNIFEEEIQKMKESGEL